MLVKCYYLSTPCWWLWQPQPVCTLVSHFTSLIWSYNLLIKKRSFSIKYLWTPPKRKDTVFVLVTLQTLVFSFLVVLYAPSFHLILHSPQAAKVIFLMYKSDHMTLQFPLTPRTSSELLLALTLRAYRSVPSWWLSSLGSSHKGLLLDPLTCPACSHLRASALRGGVGKWLPP